MAESLARQLFRRRLPETANRAVFEASSSGNDEATMAGARATAPAIARAQDSPGLRRTMSTFHLMMIGVGGTVGTGIFFIMSEAVPEAGPAVIVSFILAAVVAGLTVLCYAELASTIPSSGSSYSFTYATLGELIAFIVGACLVLEYGVSAAAVAVGWSEYLNLLLQNVFGFSFPPALSQAPDAGGVINVPAVILVALCLVLLLRGASQSAKANSIMVLIKLAVLLIFVAIAFTGFTTDHFANFAPEGMRGISMATGSLFFSYIGLDAVATAGDEVKNPKKAMPRALLGALAIVTIVYLLVAIAALGAQAPEKFGDQQASLASIVQNLLGQTWPGTLLAVGAVISIFSVTLVCLYGQTRILYSMSHDGLVPKPLGRVNTRTHVPATATWIVCAAVAVLAGLLPLGILADLTSIGTLSAFLLVSVGVIVLRKTAPDLPRGFKVPGYPVTPILSVAACIYVISGLQPVTLIAFVIWLAVALVFYFTWSRRHSTLAHRP